MLPPGIVGAEAGALNAALDELEALPVVNGPAILDENFRDGAVRVNLWCRAAHGKPSEKQPCVAINGKPESDPTAVPSFLAATKKLIERVKSQHAGCLKAAEEAAAADKKNQLEGSLYPSYNQDHGSGKQRLQNEHSKA